MAFRVAMGLLVAAMIMGAGLLVTHRTEIFPGKAASLATPVEVPFAEYSSGPAEFLKLSPAERAHVQASLRPFSEYVLSASTRLSVPDYPRELSPKTPVTCQVTTTLKNQTLLQSRKVDTTRHELPQALSRTFGRILTTYATPESMEKLTRRNAVRITNL